MNTFVIMQVHLLFVNIPNYFLCYAATHGSSRYSDFPVETFMGETGMWVRYNSGTAMLGFFLGVIGSLLVGHIIWKAGRFLPKLRQD